MLSKVTAQLVEEVFGYFDDRNRKAFGHITTKSRTKAKKEPEVLLVSLLLVLKKELPEVSAMLDDIEESLFEDNLKEARELLKQEQVKNLAKS